MQIILRCYTIFISGCINLLYMQALAMMQSHTFIIPSSLSVERIYT